MFGRSAIAFLFFWRLVSAELRELELEATISFFFSVAMCAQLPPVGPMTRTDALDAGAARKEAYEEAA